MQSRGFYMTEQNGKNEQSKTLWSLFKKHFCKDIQANPHAAACFSLIPLGGGFINVIFCAREIFVQQEKYHEQGDRRFAFQTNQLDQEVAALKSGVTANSYGTQTPSQPKRPESNVFGSAVRGFLYGLCAITITQSIISFNGALNEYFFGSAEIEHACDSTKNNCLNHIDINVKLDNL